MYACFVLHDYCEKSSVYVDEDVVNSQIEFIRRNEAEFQNNPDPIYSCNEEEGVVVTKTLAKLVPDT